VNIRTFERGDDAAQVSIYNEATADLPRFKPATLDEVRRRNRVDFDPATQFTAVEGNLPVGYATFNRTIGRVSYPWCRKGHEAAAEPLFQRVLDEMRRRGHPTAFAAYRKDWTAQADFFQAHGFRLAREMVNFVMDLVEMPTPAHRVGSSITPLRREDVPAVLAMAPGALRARTAAELEQHLFANPYFPPESAFVLRGRGGEVPAAVGVLVANAAYADPKKVDADMPCFRLGAFGTEGMRTKRIQGLFSFLTAPDRNVSSLALDLLAEASNRLHDSDAEALAAQVPSDLPHALRFYQQFFRRQGSFPVYELDLQPAS
jgi:hypothetical protein